MKNKKLVIKCNGTIRDLQIEVDRGCSNDALLVDQEPQKYLLRESPSSFPKTSKETRNKAATYSMTVQA